MFHKQAYGSLLDIDVAQINITDFFSFEALNHYTGIFGLLAVEIVDVYVAYVGFKALALIMVIRSNKKAVFHCTQIQVVDIYVSDIAPAVGIDLR